ncbi:MAG: DUF1844 domain-containing protein [Nitrospira sp.]|nr:DUF1844 domain-containing protein [Nitrospira sp.]
MAQEDPEIEVKDRRRFSPDTAEPVQQDSSASKEKTGAQEAKAEYLSDAPQGMNFASFILSLSTQALMCLGEIPDPQDGKSHQDLSAAKQFIDILGLLQEKTAGNLDKSETQLLDHILFDLRMRYVKLGKK